MPASPTCRPVAASAWPSASLVFFLRIALAALFDQGSHGSCQASGPPGVARQVASLGRGPGVAAPGDTSPFQGPKRSSDGAPASWTRPHPTGDAGRQEPRPRPSIRVCSASCGWRSPSPWRPGAGAGSPTARVIHLGVEADFRPARKAHPALLVDGFRRAHRPVGGGRRSRAPRYRPAGVRRCYVDDPFGNRIELIDQAR